MVFDGGGGIMMSSALLALCEMNQAVTGGFPLLKASGAELLFFLCDEMLWFVSILPKVFHLSEACH